MSVAMLVTGRATRAATAESPGSAAVRRQSAPRAYLQAPHQRTTALADQELVRIRGRLLVAKGHYEDLRGASLALLRRYRPDRHFFLALGRDPAPIVAFLQNLGGPNLAVNFPASGKGWPATPELWARYFRALVPEHVLRSGRDIVLIDQTNAGSGRTIALFAPIMKRHLERIGSAAKVKLLGFSTGELAQGVELLDINPYPDVMRYLKPPYEGIVSEYDRHVPGDEDARLEMLHPRPEYTRYRAAVMARMRADPSLRDLLERLPGARETFQAPTQPVRRRSPRSNARLGRPLEGDYALIRDLGAETLRRFPPHDHFYLGVGQGATPLLAFLRNVGGSGAARYLAADGLSQTVEPEWQAAYAHYLRSVLPSDVVWGYRKLVAFLPAQSEYRLAKLQELLTQALPYARITIAGMGSGGFRRFPTLPLDPSQVQRLTARYKASAPFAFHRIGADPAHALRPSRAYVRFERELGHHMAQDAELQAFLAGL